MADPASDLAQVLHLAHRTIESLEAECDENSSGIFGIGPNPGATSDLGSQVLQDLANFVGRFVSLTRSEIIVVALWIAHTWAIEASDFTPYLAVTSAEKQSGKTRLLEVLELLVRRPWRTARVTSAVLYRRIGDDAPTLLLDEWDATAKGNAEFAETLRGILNSGHQRNGKISLCVGKNGDYKPADFSVFCPKAIAGIGKLPDTIADRSIPIRLKRKARGERIERFRIKHVRDDASHIRNQVAGWAKTHLDRLRESHPLLPDSLSDRQQDGAEPLLTIADAAGGDWPSQARTALVDLCSGSAAVDESIGARLLGDIRNIFRKRNVDRLASRDLVRELSKIEGSPWPAWDHSESITPNALARLLASFDVWPDDLRVGGSVAKGYRCEWFADAWNRYLPIATSPGSETATSLQAAEEEVQCIWDGRRPS